MALATVVKIKIRFPVFFYPYATKGNYVCCIQLELYFLPETRRTPKKSMPPFFFSEITSPGGVNNAIPSTYGGIQGLLSETITYIMTDDPTKSRHDGM